MTHVRLTAKNWDQLRNPTFVTVFLLVGEVAFLLLLLFFVFFIPQVVKIPGVKTKNAKIKMSDGHKSDYIRFKPRY